MRFKMLIISFLLSIAFLATVALCVNWDDPNSQNIDEMLSSGEEYTYNSPTPGQAATPQKQREIDKNKSSVNWIMPTTLSNSADSAKESRNQAESSEGSSDDTTASTTETLPKADTSSTIQSELPPSEQLVPSVGGSWSFTLTDSLQRDLALSLFQKGSDIFGAGRIREGNNTLDVAVSGLVQNETMDMNIISLGTIGLYKLTLNLSGESATGDYQALYTSGESVIGSAEGLKTT